MPDGNYTWEDTGITLGMEGVWDGYVINMTSQQWLTPQDVSRSVWWHIMVIIVPKNVIHTDSAFVWITGGNNEGNVIPNEKDEDIIVTAYTAVATNTIGVALFQIPNQHIVFAADPAQQSRSEDAIIAFTWWYFMDHQDEPEWLLRLPMTKAVVRCMDTVTAFAKQQLSYDVEDFYVAGASKRGWTTWTTAAVDTRVKAMAPIVMDELNFVENVHHHYKAYGGWSFALKDYYEMNFTKDLDEPGTQAIMDIVDPIMYVDRYEGMPKIICDAGMDEFFLPDDQTFWWSDMTDPKHMLMVPNAEHSLATGILEILPAVASFMGDVVAGKQKEIPTYTWEINNSTGEITVVTSAVPKSVHVWHAYTCNSERRDFRVLNIDDPCTCGIAQGDYCLNLKVGWFADKIPVNGTTYKALVEAPDDGRWVAFFIDVKFDAAAAVDATVGAEKDTLLNLILKDSAPLPGWPVTLPGTLEFTSGVSILPQMFPFPDCTGTACTGVLV